MINSSFNNMLWWTLWGLAIGGGLFALKESFHNSYYFLMAMPLLTGAIAAAISRLSHEYRKAAAEIKWLAISALAALAAMAFLYVRAGAYGPFAMGGSQRAFLDVTFGMSVPEVERSVGRRLLPLDPLKEPPVGVNAWFFDLVSPARGVRAQYLLSNLELFAAPCQARLDFFEGRLGHVQIEFDKVPHDAAPALAERLRDELSKVYHPVAVAAVSADSTTTASSTATPNAALPLPTVFQKDDVEAHLLENPLDAFNDALAVELAYLPLARGKPLRADHQVF